MIRLVGMSLMVLITLIAGGASKFLCDEDDTVSAPEPIDAQEAYVDSTTFGICSQTFWVETRIVSGDTALSFVLTLINENDSGIVAMGDQVVLTRNWYCDTTFTLSVSYWDNITPGTYRLVLLIYDASKSSDKDDLDMRERLFAREVAWVQVPDFSGETCPVFPSDTLGDGGCTREYNWVKGERHFLYQAIDGLKGTIKMRHASLCGDIASTTLEPFSLAAISFVDTSAPDTPLRWCETGFVNQRIIDDKGIREDFQTWFREIEGVDYHFPRILYLLSHIPDGTVSSFKIILNNNNGTFDFYKDDSVFFSSDPISYWEGRLGQEAQIFTEVQFVESDMMGTELNPCVIHSVATRSPGANWQGVDIALLANPPNYLGSDNPIEWPFRATSDSLIIWDAFPLP